MIMGSDEDDMMDEDEAEWESGSEGEGEDEPSDAEVAAELDALIGRKKVQIPPIPTANDKKAKKAKIVELTSAEDVKPAANGAEKGKKKEEAKKAEPKKKEEPKKKVEAASPAATKKESAKAVAKQQQQQQPKQETPVKKEAAPVAEKKEKPEKKVLPNGLAIEDIEIGKGPKCKNGKKVNSYLLHFPQNAYMIRY